MEDQNTTQQAPAINPQSEDQTRPPISPVPEGKKFQKTAVWAFVFSLLGMVLVYIGPLVAIILAVVALRAIAKTGNKGKKLAIAAIVLASLSLVVSVLAPASGGFVDKLSNGGSAGSQQDETSKQTADKFVAALKSQDYDTAYSLFADQAKQDTAKEDLEAGVKSYGDLSDAKYIQVVEYTTKGSGKTLHTYVYSLRQDSATRATNLYVIVDPSDKHVFYVNTGKDGLADIKWRADSFAGLSGASEL